MTGPQAHAKNLNTLKRAAKANALALVEGQRVADGKVVTLLSTVAWDEEHQEYVMTPFAEMVDGNPYKLYRPPLPEGGFAGG